MAALFDRIRDAVGDDRYLVSLHASDRLEERSVTEWQVVSGLAESRLLRERPSDQPNPAVEVEQVLPDGTPIKVVWSWIETDQIAKLVTVHFYDG
jgi:hypothetical protein